MDTFYFLSDSTWSSLKCDKLYSVWQWRPFCWWITDIILLYFKFQLSYNKVAENLPLKINVYVIALSVCLCKLISLGDIKRSSGKCRNHSMKCIYSESGTSSSNCIPTETSTSFSISTSLNVSTHFQETESFLVLFAVFMGLFVIIFFGKLLFWLFLFLFFFSYQESVHLFSPFLF